ncbi:von_Willebrand factor type A domain-containing protein [Hexamita inflata]|uniref:von_Willebrand factor type A domain-containing protein n=1 Tax=Hexamita inflata TaxID=28002 RepID=A0ABP1I0U4_9EUKA
MTSQIMKLIATLIIIYYIYKFLKLAFRKIQIFSALKRITKDTVEVVAILDKSGSMRHLINDTIGGFNAYLQELQKQENQVNVTLIQFNGKCHIQYEHQPVKRCKKLTKRSYQPYGSTALNDSLGKAITNMQAYLQQISNDKRPSKISFFVSTDGAENSSCKYTQEQVKKLVESCTEEKWEFLFAGANIDPQQAGQALGFQKENIAFVENDGIGQQAMFQAMAQKQSGQYKISSMQDIYTENSKQIRMK